MAKRSGVITMSPISLDQEDDFELDLNLWEVVNPSDCDYSDDSFSVHSLPDDDDVISLDDASFLSRPVISPPPHVIPEADGYVNRDDELGWDQRRLVFLGGGSVGNTYGNYVDRYGCNDDNDEDQGVEDDDSYDLDDELVPRNVSAKLGRQRMRKLGKRAIAKVYKSPYYHLKPGCKHGLSKFRTPR